MSSSNFATEIVRSAISLTKKSSRSFTVLYSASSSTLAPPNSSKRIFNFSSSCRRSRCLVRSSFSISALVASTLYSRYIVASRPSSATASCSSLLKSSRSRSTPLFSNSKRDSSTSASRRSLTSLKTSLSASLLSLWSDSIAERISWYAFSAFTSSATADFNFSSKEPFCFLRSSYSASSSESLPGRSIARERNCRNEWTMSPSERRKCERSSLFIAWLVSFSSVVTSLSMSA